MKRTSLFNVKLYAEGLHQTMVFGILTMIITELATLLGFAGALISQYSLLRDYSYGYLFANCVADITTISPLFTFASLISALVLPLILFGFMNKRNQSDFYHVLPHKRSTIFFSFTCSILTWILANMLLSFVSGFCLYSCFLKETYIYSFPALLKSFLAVFVMVLLVYACTMLAKTITGTLFSNLIVTALILFLPRFILMMIRLVVLNEVASVTHMAFPFGEFNILCNFMRFYGANDVYYFTKGILYTLILAFIYLSAAFFLFGKRKSESAGQSSPTRTIQAIYRIAVAFVISIVGTLLIVDSILSNQTISAEEYLVIAGIYFAAVIAFFVFEIITTKTSKNLVRILPTLLVVVAINVITGFSTSAIYNGYQKPCPDISKISYVSWSDYNNNGFTFIADYSESNDYFNLQSEKLQLKDQASKKLAVDAWTASINNYYANEPYAPYELKVCLQSGKTLYRNVNLTESQQETLLKIFQNNKEYQKIITTLPDATETKTSIYLDNGNRLFTKEEVLSVYNTFRAEVAETGNTSYFTEYDSSMGNFGFITFYDGQLVQGSFNLTNAYPKTAQLYMDYAMKHVDKDPSWIQEVFSSDKHFYINCMFRGREDGDYFDNSCSDDSRWDPEYQNAFEKAVAWSGQQTKIDITKPFYCFEITIEQEDEKGIWKTSEKYYYIQEQETLPECLQYLISDFRDIQPID